MAGPVRRGYPEEDRLPWLEERPAEARRAPAPFGAGRLLLVVGALALLLAVAWFGYRWRVHGETLAGAPGVIRAPAGPYKVRPAEPGGLDVNSEGSAALSASEGEDPRAAINLAAVPEEPVTRAPATPAETATGGAGQIQLGAFSTEAKANAAWKALAARFAFLQPLEPVVVPALVGEATVYRLRAPAGVNAVPMCGRLRVAGETCIVVGG